MSGIVIAHLNKVYKSRTGKVPALIDINLDVGDGEFVSVIGPSGCGKSTLLYILGGFIAADGGSVLVDGKQVNGPGTDRGIVFQEYALFPWLTVEQNIHYGLEMLGMPRRERDEIVRNLIHTVNLEGFEHRFPRELSGGMKQRVAIARTLAYNPHILLLDEPFGALDSQTRESMQDELQRLWLKERKTVVLVTHDVDEAVYLSERVVVVSKRPGRIVEEFKIAVDREGGREATMLSEAFTRLRNEVWLSVRRQVGGASGREEIAGR
ncbi:MAG: ABC transporter ATP-binding protein [Xanthobacteraceae bacterium]